MARSEEGNLGRQQPSPLVFDPEPTSGPPALDLANRDLVEAHLHAVWLAREQIDANHVFQGTQF
jgi:hypothetical protein